MRINVEISKNQDPKMTKLTYQFVVCLRKEARYLHTEKYTVIRYAVYEWRAHELYGRPGITSGHIIIDD